MKVVVAKLKDAHAAAKILQESYSSFKEAKKYLLEKIKNREVLVALNPQVAGVLVYTRKYSHYANYVEDIVVKKEERRKGMGSLLLKKYIALSKRETRKKQPFALSSVNKANTASLKMHMKFGFQPIGLLQELHYGEDVVFFGYRIN